MRQAVLLECTDTFILICTIHCFETTKTHKRLRLGRQCDAIWQAFCSVFNPGHLKQLETLLPLDMGGLILQTRSFSSILSLYEWWQVKSEGTATPQTAGSVPPPQILRTTKKKGERRKYIKKNVPFATQHLDWQANHRHIHPAL